MMAATGGNTGDARQASRGKTTGLQCDQERRLFGHAFTVLMMIPYPSLRVLADFDIPPSLDTPSQRCRESLEDNRKFLFFSCTWCFHNELL